MSTHDEDIGQIYDQRVLAPEIVQGIVEKERAHIYPLDRLNDMRALINYAAYYVRQWLPKLDFLVDLARDPRRMSGGRLLRVHQTFLVALATETRLENDSVAQFVNAARTLGNVLVQRVRAYPGSESMVSMTGIGNDTDVVTPLVAAVGWKAGELADRLGMGEHVLYAHSPVQGGQGGTVVSRSHFYQRVCSDFPHRLVTVTVLRPGHSYAHVVPIYRSRALTAILPEDRQGNWLLVDDDQVRDSTMLAAVEERLTRALQRVYEYEDYLSQRVDLDWYKMNLYSVELSDAMTREHERWRMPAEATDAVTGRKVTRALGLFEDDSYAELFFRLTREGLAVVRRGGISG
ncbi:hypothetical protein ACFQ1S_02400 [Kibdelosporangium lantanae]|uniref:Uncharacterized protein n=1 Tax=Kibdelosporangium lantanae TaxID=1497396 RepID=A0ABW3M1F1_9PSEU